MSNNEVVVAGTEQARRAAGLTVTHSGPTETVERPRTVYDFLEAIKGELGRAMKGLPGMDPDRIARLALTVVRTSELQAKRRNDQRYSLAACSPESFAGALLVCAASGLVPHVWGEAWLIPRQGEVTFVPGYQGYVKLFWQHPEALFVDGALVRENDEFEWSRGLNPHLHHKPILGGVAARGNIIGYYAFCQYRHRPPRVVFLEPEDTLALRGREGPSDPKIPDPQHWLEVKTALRQVFKLEPKTPRLALAVEADQRSGAELLDDPKTMAALHAAVDNQPPAAIEGTVVNDDVEIPEADPEPDQAEPDRAVDVTRETITVQPAPPRPKAVMNNDRRRLIKQLREAHGDAAAAAIRYVARDPELHPDYATNEEITAATGADPAEIAAWQQDLALASAPPTTSGDDPSPANEGP